MINQAIIKIVFVCPHTLCVPTPKNCFNVFTGIQTPKPNVSSGFSHCVLISTAMTIQRLLGVSQKSKNFPTYLPIIKM